MRAFDFSPLFRSTVGFENVTRLLEAATRLDEGTISYPPYNIEKLGDDQYRITMAVAGFGEGDLEITQSENALIVVGKKDKPEDESKYVHRGIATRSFKRRFQLADFIRVTRASMENGLLHIDLVREVPEALKPRTIAIEASTSNRNDQKAA